MKKIFILTTIAIWLLSCNRTGSVRSIIPGTYVHNYKHLYAQGRDTIIIKKFGKDAYSIVRRTYYQVIRDGQPQDSGMSIHQYAGVYQPETNTVLETKGGVVLSFNEAQGTMQWGTAVYNKIK